MVSLSQYLYSLYICSVLFANNEKRIVGYFINKTNACKWNRSHHGIVSRQNSTDSVHNMHQSEPRMLTIETIWTGTNDVLADYMDPQDVRR